MRYIHKPADAYTRELDQQQALGAPTTDDEATRRWGNFNGKRLLSCKLLQEQFGLCCYTELNLTDMAKEEQAGFHIEHEQPKSSYLVRTFDYHNLLLSALNDKDLQRFSGEHQFGGHFKKGKYDPALFISPQQPDCRDYFIYSSDNGEISPNLSRSTMDQQKAEYTIELLNLNAPFLKAERQQWLEEIEELINSLLDKDGLDSIKLIAQAELTPYRQHHPQLRYTCDQLRKFHSAVRAIFGQLGEQVIQEHYPNLG